MTKPSLRPVATPHYNGQLIEGCRHCIAQCDLLLNLISTEHYIESSSGSSIGAHMRHMLERFQCFFHGLPGRHINYDARKRDRSLEVNLEAARFALTAVGRHIDVLDQSKTDSGALSVQESVYHEGPFATSSSTVGRELMGLITHTTHHLAIIALLIKSLGYTVGSDFGKAPSTILYERQQQHE